MRFDRQMRSHLWKLARYCKERSVDEELPHEQKHWKDWGRELTILLRRCAVKTKKVTT